MSELAKIVFKTLSLPFFFTFCIIDSIFEIVIIYQNLYTAFFVNKAIYIFLEFLKRCKFVFVAVVFSQSPSLKSSQKPGVYY